LLTANSFPELATLAFHLVAGSLVDSFAGVVLSVAYYQLRCEKEDSIDQLTSDLA
jgi:hypothetical protein